MKNFTNIVVTAVIVFIAISGILHFTGSSPMGYGISGDFTNASTSVTSITGADFLTSGNPTEIIGRSASREKWAEVCNNDASNYVYLYLTNATTTNMVASAGIIIKPYECKKILAEDWKGIIYGIASATTTVTYSVK